MNLRSPKNLFRIFLILSCVAAVWLGLRSFEKPNPSGSLKDATVESKTAAPTPVLSASTPTAPEPPNLSSGLPSPSVVTPLAKEPAPSKSDVPSRFIFSSAWGHSEHPLLAAFENWTTRFLDAAPDEREALIAEGVLLAQARRQALAKMIKSDPKQALASAVPVPIRAQLPTEIVDLLEARVAGEAKLAVLGVTPAPGITPEASTYRTATVNGKSYRAYTYGRRDAQATKLDISVLGVAVDGAIAVSESPLRVLDVGEVAPEGKPVNEICPISGDQTPVAETAPLNQGAQNAVEVAGQIYRLCHIAHVVQLEDRLVQAENQAGPYRGALRAGLAAKTTAADGLPGTSGLGTSLTGHPPANWTIGNKKVLVIRVDFPDLPNDPVATTSGSASITSTFTTNLFNGTNGVGAFYNQSSYGQTSLAVTVTPLLHLTLNAGSYAAADKGDTLHDEARALALASGIDSGSYDFVGVVFSKLSNYPNSKITYGGQGEVQGKNFWINGQMTFGTVAHEIGHNFGLNHSSLWQVTDGTPISDNGSSTEYGDIFGVMGDGSDINAQFDMWQKSILSWIPDNAVQTISASGTYRVYRFDHQSASITSGTAHSLALKVVKDSNTDTANGRDYWIGFRQLFTNNNWLMNGAYIIWGYNSYDGGTDSNNVPYPKGGHKGQLLDFNTTGTSAEDAALAIGTSFYDPAANITITPIGKGGTTPNEYLDVRVNFGAPSAAPPVITSVTSTANARQATTITANASDADGDTLSYSWDFGSGPIFTNSPSVTRTFPVGGTYNVTVKVSDMNGHTIPATQTITVSDPLTSWTARSVSTGANAKFMALATNGTQVLAVGEDSTTNRGPVALSTDGITWSGTSTATLGFNNHGYGAVWGGTQWVVAGKGATTDWVGRIWTSSDAVTWNSNYFEGPVLNAIATNGTITVAVGDSGTIVRSVNGGTWTQQTSGTSNKLSSIAYGGGKFVALGHFYDANTNVDTGSSTVLTSTDGITWTNVSTGAGTLSWQDVRTITYGGTQFVASGFWGKIRYSSTGSTFSTTRTTSEQTPAIAYGNNVWFAAGIDKDNSDATIDLISTDGQNWTSTSPGTLPARNAAIFFKNTFITVGDNHSIRQSGTVPAPSVAPVITVPGTLTGTVGTAITTGTVTADQTVTFSATGLPSGISLNTTTGIVSGTPTASGTSTVTVTATNSNGSSSGSFNIVIQNPPAPTIVTAPVAQTLVSGGSISLSVTASGTPPFTYQWLINGSTISGATLSTYTLANAGTANAGSYAVTVSNLGGSVTSGSVAVVVNVPPSITVQPVGQTLASEGNISLSVTATGTAPLAYQWFLNSGSISGATSSTYSFNNATVANAGSYSVTVSNVAGSVTSSNVAVAVTSSPVITAQPAGQTFLNGGTISLSVTATGTAPLTYQWFLNNGSISGATSSTYSFQNATVANAGTYKVTVTNSAGVVTSSDAAVVMAVAPAITVQPVGQTLVAGGTVALSVTATGTAPLNYQWFLNNGSIAGGTSSTYTLTNAGTANAGTYTVAVSNVAGTVTSSNAAVVVNVPPSITTQPVAQTILSGGSVSLSVTAAGTAPLTYQWFLNSGSISGATSSTYTFPNASTANAGTYTVTVSNVAGSVTSANTAVAVNVPPAITAQPVGQTLVAGGTVALSVTASGTPAVNYQWFLNSGSISGATLATYTFPNATATNAGTYAVTVSNVAGSVTSSNAVVVVNVPPSITVQPVPQTLVIGGTISLNVTAAGTNPLAYQWLFNGGSLNGATLSSYIQTNAGSLQTGSYAVTVTNPFGTITSGSVAVRVNSSAPPVFTTAPGATLAGSIGNPLTGGQFVTDQVATFTSGTLPPGLTLNATTGLLSGTPTALGTTPVTVTATNDNGSVSKTFNVVIASHAPLTITAPPANMSTVAGAAASLAAHLVDDVNVVTTSYQIRQAGTTTPVGLAGSISSGTGSFYVPLRSIRSTGNYEIVFTRNYLDGSSETITSDPFAVNITTWDSTAGRYDGLLIHNEGTVGDSAVYRGRISLTLSKSGSFSGSIQYTEAELLSGGSLLVPPPRTYVPVTRTFTGVLTPLPGESLKFSFTRSLGLGSAAGREQLQLSADLSVTPPVITATVTDHVTITPAVNATGAKSVASMTRLPLTLVGGSAASAVGKYILSANSGNTDANKGQVFALVMPSGRIIWTSRCGGYNGSGASNLNVTTTANTAVFYEAKSTFTSSQLTSTVLMGRLNLVSSGTGTLTWTPSFGGPGQPDGIERFVSKVPVKTISSALTPYYDELKFGLGSAFTKRSVLDFSNHDGLKWSSSTVVTLPTGLVSPNSLVLSLAAPNGDPLYRWSVLVSTNGAANVTGLPALNGDLPPQLRFTLNMSQGEWIGSFRTPDTNARVSLFGAVTAQPNDVSVQSVGWAETGLIPNQILQAWTLK